MTKFLWHFVCATFYVVMLAHPRVWLWFASIWFLLHLYRMAEIGIPYALRLTKRLARRMFASSMKSAGTKH